MKKEDVDLFEKLVGQLNSLYTELSTLSKKSPNDAVNKFKVKFINGVLENCNSFFGDGYRPFPEFTTFSDEAIPSNSDVSFMLSQYLEAAELKRADNIFMKGGMWFWKVEDSEAEQPLVRTLVPKRLDRK